MIGWCRAPCSTWRGVTPARICVGKAAGGAGSTQAEINALLIEHARQGRRVVRLKGGDPFIFGRGGEELEALHKAQIRFSVIPGITAAAGCAAYAGIPLTHRDHAHSVTFVTGHEDRDGRGPDWAALARPGITSVFYMGLARVQQISAALVQHGAPEALPAALIAQGTQDSQRVVRGTLAHHCGGCASCAASVAHALGRGRGRVFSRFAGVVQQRGATRSFAVGVTGQAIASAKPRSAIQALLNSRD